MMRLIDKMNGITRCDVDCKGFARVKLKAVTSSNHRPRSSTRHVNFKATFSRLRSFPRCSGRAAIRCGSTLPEKMMKMKRTSCTTRLTPSFANTQFTRTWRCHHPVHLTHTRRRNFTVQCQVHLTSLEFANRPF